MLTTCRDSGKPLRCRPKPGCLLSYSAVVDAYIRERRESAESERQSYKRRRSLRETIEFAALCKLPGGKRHPHQYRIPRAALAEAGSSLQGCATEIRCCKTFEELHELVQREVGGIPRIGALTVYDVATRIGAYLDLAPAHVYLHAGTAAGAKALGLGGTDKLRPAQLPAPFQRLHAYEIEDCLCIYKEELQEVSVKR